MKKKKILFIFVSDEYLRNFHENKVVQNLKKNFKIAFALEKKSIFKYKHFQRHKDCIGSFEFSKEQIKDFNLLNWSNSIINENLSKTFRFQNKGIYLKVNLKYFGESFIKSIFFFLPRIYLKFIKLKNYYLFKLIKNNSSIKQKYLKKYNNNKIVEIVQNYKPDLIAFPNRGNHPALFAITNNFKHKTLLMCDNWDNPSSKSYIDPKPKFITVWGKQSMSHAIQCNNYKKKEIQIIGTPKYETFYRNKTKNLKSYFKFKYFLVLESWIYDGVQETLCELNEIISKNKIFENYKVVFRPHPHRSHSKTYDISKLKNVIFDPDVQIDKNSKVDGRVRTNLSYYPSLIKNAELVISGPTTMILEACMFYKKIILIGLKSKNFFNHRNTLNNMIHLKELNRFPNLLINKNIGDLSSQVLRFMRTKRIYSKKEINKTLGYFLTNKSVNYNKNLLSCFRKLT